MTRSVTFAILLSATLLSGCWSDDGTAVSNVSDSRFQGKTNAGLDIALSR